MFSRMFVLVEMVDTVRIPPWNFQRQLNEAVTEELNKKLANKVRSGLTSHSMLPMPVTVVTHSLPKKRNKTKTI